MFILFLAGCAFAQSAEMVDKILESEKVTYGQISYLSAIHQNLIEEEASEEEAVTALINAKQLSADTTFDSVIKLDNLSCLYLRMWPSVKGGLMFRITKGSPRYAFKQLKEDGILSANSDPKDEVSGFEAMTILSSCMMYYAAEEEKMTLDDNGLEER